MAKVNTGVKACRLCLIMDVKMREIEISQENSMKSLLGKDMISTSSLPQYMCYECAAYVRKFKKFREKCVIAQSILYTLLKSNKEITEKDIRNIDRKMVNLESQLSYNNLPLEEPQPLLQTTIKVEPEHVDLDMDVEEIKIEMDSDYFQDHEYHETFGNYDQDNDDSFILNEDNEKKKVNRKTLKNKSKVKKKIADVVEVKRVPKNKILNEAVTEESAMSNDFTVTKLSLGCNKRRTRNNINYITRARIVALRSQGKNLSEIARETGVNRKTVVLWVRRFQEEGSLDHRNRSRRRYTDIYF